MVFTPATLPEPGDIVCLRYRIEERLDAGGIGVVFAAKNLATGRGVAIEVLHRGGDELHLARLLASARATAKVEHPNVVRILDVHEDDGVPYLVMERLRGESLRQRLERAGRLAVEEALQTVLEAARGVAAAHRAGILHRGLRPDSILLVEGEDGGPRSPKVLDFGIAEPIEAQDGPTGAGTAIATLAYMSPEQLAGAPADPRFDVYAMAVVLYECLAGVRPYRATQPLPLMTEISAGLPPPIRSFAPDVPPALEAFVLRAMSADRAARPPSMDAFVDALEQLELEPATTILGRPIAPPQAFASTPAPPSAPPRRSAPAAPGRSPWLLAVASFVGFSILGIAGIAVAAGAWALVSDDESDAPPPVAATGPATVAPPEPADPRAPDVNLRFGGSCVADVPDTDFYVSSVGSTISVLWQTSAREDVMLMVRVNPELRGTVPITEATRGVDVRLVVGARFYSSSEPAGLREPARVGGNLQVTAFDDIEAASDLSFQQVVLRATDGSPCVIDGRLVTRGSSYDE